MSPEAAGLPAALFPAAYVELQKLKEAEHGNLRQQLDDASGRLWLPDAIDWQDNPAARATAEAELDANRERQRVLRHQLGINSPLDAATLTLGAVDAAMIGHSGISSLWSTRFAESLNEDGFAEGSAGAMGIHDMAPLLADNPSSAIAFYNELGASGASKLTNTYEYGMRRSFSLLADGLGRAAASGELNFSGDEFVRSGLGSPTSPLQLLAITDQIPDDFLIDATVASLVLSSRTAIGYGPYADYPPPGADLATGPIGRYQGQTEPGVYGNNRDDTDMVMLNLIGERGPTAVLEVMRGLGPEHADAVLRLETGPFLTAPIGWGEGGGNRLTEILYHAANPDYTGDAELSDEAARWIINGAGNPAPGSDLALPASVGDAVERILVDRHTVMVQGPSADQYFADGGMDRSEFDQGFDAPTIGDAIEGVFRGGEGDQLLTLQTN